MAVSKEDKHITIKSGQQWLQHMMAGWKLLVNWKDGMESWETLADMKQSHPVEMTVFTRARGISDEAVFAWWVPYTLRKRDVILSSVKTHIQKATHKYGIEVPTNVAHAMEINRRNNNSLWQDTLAKEMFNVSVTFEVLDAGERAPHGWSKVTGHLVWDVKIDFTHKACWVLDGHKTPDPVGSMYAGVVSHESVCIIFMYAALNGLNACVADIRNAYLQALSSRRTASYVAQNLGSKLWEELH